MNRLLGALAFGCFASPAIAAATEIPQVTPSAGLVFCNTLSTSITATFALSDNPAPFRQNIAAGRCLRVAISRDPGATATIGGTASNLRQFTSTTLRLTGGVQTIQYSAGACAPRTGSALCLTLK